MWLREVGVSTAPELPHHTASASGVLSWAGVEVTDFKVRKHTFPEYSFQFLTLVVLPELKEEKAYEPSVCRSLLCPVSTEGAATPDLLASANVLESPPTPPPHSRKH